MPSGKCTGCGQMTNSATSNWWSQDGVPTECYAAYVNGEWVPGCGYAKADQLTKNIMRALFKRGDDAKANETESQPRFGNSSNGEADEPLEEEE